MGVDLQGKGKEWEAVNQEFFRGVSLPRGVKKWREMLAGKWGPEVVNDS